MTADDIEAKAKANVTKNGFTLYVTGKTIKDANPHITATTDGMAIVDHQMYLVTQDGIWKIES